MKHSLIYFLLVMVFSFSAISTVKVEQLPPTKDVVEKMIKAIQSVNCISYTMNCYEKSVFDNSIVHGNSFIKIKNAPYKIYVKLLSGNDAGTELLFPARTNLNKVIVNAGKWVPNLKIEPLNTLITKKQHHSIFSAGFGYMLKIVLQAKQTALEQNAFDSFFSLDSKIIFNGEKCSVLKVTYKNQKTSTYKTLCGDNVNAVATRLMLSEYEIMRLNNLKDIADDIGNRTIIIPGAFAKQAVFYVSEKTFLPLYESSLNANGEFERYEFSNIQINPAFTDLDFSSDNPAYGF